MRVALLLAFTLLWGETVDAQEKPRLHVAVEQLGRSALACGIDQSSIESIAALTLRNNGIHPSVQSTNPFLNVQVAVQPARTGNNLLGCFLNIDVSVRGLREGSDIHMSMGQFKARVVAAHLLCEAGHSVVGAVSETPSLLTRALEQSIKLCLGELEY